MVISRISINISLYSNILEIKNKEKMENKEREDQVRQYVYNNYRSYKNKTLYISEHDNHFKVLLHPTGAPLVLGKKVIE